MKGMVKMIFKMDEDRFFSCYTDARKKVSDNNKRIQLHGDRKALLKADRLGNDLMKLYDYGVRAGIINSLGEKI